MDGAPTPRAGGGGAAAKRKVKVCQYCGREFNHAVNRTLHIRRAHTHERPFTCPVEGCDKVRARPRGRARAALTRRAVVHFVWRS